MPTTFEQPTVEGKEAIPESKDEMFIRTEKGSMRGELLSRNGTERVVRPTWSHDGSGIGSVIKFDIGSLKRGEPFRFSVSADNGGTFGPEHTASKLDRAGRWEKGVHISLDDLYNKTDAHSLSDSLPQNMTVATDEHLYSEAYPAYEHVSEGISFAQEHPDQAKCNFALGNANEGWKVHINVTPENVAPAADYLKQNGYAHKYLTGGIGTEGAAFTIYFGAKSMSDKWAPQISRDLIAELCKPLIKNEVELAPGVVGRFTSLDPNAGTDDNAFLQYGEYGMSARRGYIKNRGGWPNIKTQEDKRELAKDAYEHLSRRYGSYFHG